MTPEPELMVTVGPACWDSPQLYALLTRGVRTFRFPFAKEDPNTHRANHRRLVEIAHELGVTVAAIADLPGGKPRLTNWTPLSVEPDELVQIRYAAAGAEAALQVEPELDVSSLAGGSDVWIGDGETSFHVVRVEDGVAEGRFSHAGMIGPRRAFLPQRADVRFQTWTENDRRLAKEARAIGFDGVALSFVAHPDDVHHARRWLRDELGWRPGLVAKVRPLRGLTRSRK